MLTNFNPMTALEAAESSVSGSYAGLSAYRKRAPKRVPMSKSNAIKVLSSPSPVKLTMRSIRNACLIEPQTFDSSPIKLYKR